MTTTWVEGAAGSLFDLDNLPYGVFSRAGEDPRYTKHPATWLNGNCWEDEPSGDGAPMLDADGNVVDEPRREPYREPRGFMEIAAEMAEEIRANGDRW